MKVDKEPIINESNRTLTVIDTITGEVSISINGLMAIHADDIENISDSVITLVPGLDIDWENDYFAVFYE
jgi:hypothetical protein